AHGGARFGDIRAKSSDKHTIAAGVEKADKSCRGADHIHDNAHVSGNSQGARGKESNPNLHAQAVRVFINSEI
ncbi:hypothetical protein, partial [Mesorhizobium sp. M0870]|uniref:hypothetical protein n=1 Tax=Mesorhizobium sp. M0870 TaxID=2957016 RepID=UPI00333D3CF3